MKLVRPCLVVIAFLLSVCCGLYPAAVTAAAAVLFPDEASGSLLLQNGAVRGSLLIGQVFENPADHPTYFWGRPSAASVDGPTGVVVSGGSNRGPMNTALREEVSARVAALRAAGVSGAIPVDLVTRSGSGLDPHLSVAAAEVQIPRVARARGLSERAVREIVRAHTAARTLGFLGEARVNVLECNLALDAQGAGSK